MKANRKFIDGEEAVSAVIGVILMVAITVAIAATVYVYVSGMMGGGTDATPTMAISVDNADDKFTVVSAEIDVAWSDVQIKSDLACNVSANGGAGVNLTAGTYVECSTFVLTGDVTAGDYFTITWPATGSIEFTFLYVPTNAIMSTAKIVI